MKRFATMMGALLLVPTMACAELIEIAELTKEVPETWLEKIDVNGKTVSVDVPIYTISRLKYRQNPFSARDAFNDSRGQIFDCKT